MAWNSEKNRYECDRCGKPITRSQMLCKECNEWLEKYVSECKELRNNANTNIH